MKKTLNHPFHKVVRDANKVIAEGATVYQKFTCSGCGERLGMEKPNVFYTTGTCDKCNVVTNIKLTGCNYMTVWRMK